MATFDTSYHHIAPLSKESLDANSHRQQELILWSTPEAISSISQRACSDLHAFVKVLNIVFETVVFFLASLAMAFNAAKPVSGSGLLAFTSTNWHAL